MTLPTQVWCDALRRLQSEIPDFAFDAWIAPIGVKAVEDRLVLGCPTPFHRERVRLHHLAALERCWRAARAAHLGDLSYISASAASRGSHADTDPAESKSAVTPATTKPGLPQTLELVTAAEFETIPGQTLDPRAIRRVQMGMQTVAATPELAEAQVLSGGGSRGEIRPIRPHGGTTGDPGGGHSVYPAATPDSKSSFGDRSTQTPTAFQQPMDRSAPPAISAPAPSSTPSWTPSMRPASSGAPHSTGQFGTRQPASGSGAHSNPHPNPHSDALTPAAGAPRGSNTPRSETESESGTPRRQDRPIQPGRSPAAPSGPGLNFQLQGETHPKEPACSFESFIVGPCNALAREAALALARRRQRSLNQLYIGGGTGMGKTHLARATVDEARRMAMSHPVETPPGATFSNQAAHATARRLRNPMRGKFSAPSGPASANRESRFILTSAEQFTSEFVSAMRNGRNEEWTKRYRGKIDLLVVEDIQFLSGRGKTQLELFHTIDHVLDSGGRVLLTGDRAPRDLSGLDERLRAQVSRGFVTELEAPDALVRRHILRTKSAAGGVHLPADCLDLLVDATDPHAGAAPGTGGQASSEGSVRDIEGVLIQVVTTASLLGRPIDLALTQEAIDLKSGAGSHLAPRALEVSEVVRIVASFFGTRPEAMASRSRRRDVLVPRQLAMYLAHRYTESSLTEIGRGLGRDHPSVRNAIQRIERQVLENAPVRYQVEALSERIDRLLKEGPRT